MSRRIMPSTLTAALGIALLSTAAPASTPRTAIEEMSGPPWISIEYPANPYDEQSRGAFLLVHAFHHGTAVGYPVSGTAEGLVDGRRRSVKLEFTPTSRPGVYALRKSWSDEGTWTLVITASQGPSDGATAVVEIGTRGEVASVNVPTRKRGSWIVPDTVAMADVERGLAERATRLAQAHR